MPNAGEKQYKTMAVLFLQRFSSCVCVCVCVGGGGVLGDFFTFLGWGVFLKTCFRNKSKEAHLRASNKNAADKHQSESSLSSCDSEEDEDLTRKVI